jgi:hypothetical protein
MATESFLDKLGIDKAKFDEASSSTVTEAYEVLESGAYPGVIKNMIIYKNKYDGTMLRVEIELTEPKRVLSFRSDVGKLLKDGAVNGGFLSRLKSIAEACNFNADDFGIGAEIKFQSYGSETVGNVVTGVIGKKVVALVRKSEDTDRPETDTYRISNDIEGITQKGSEDFDTFAEKVEKSEGKPFKFKSGYKPKGSTAKGSTANSEETKKDLEEVDF